MYLPRLLEARLSALSAGFPVVVITGARQVGKSTMARRVGDAEERPRSYVSLAEFGPRSLAESDPALFLQRYPPPVLIDEIQAVPELFGHLRELVDRGGMAGGWWLTGSQQLPLMKGLSESLAGRIGLLELHGLSVAEEAGAPFAPLPFRPDRVRGAPGTVGTELLPTFERILRGALPRLVHPDAPPRDAYLGSYIQTYLERDVRTLLDVSDLATFRRFMRVAASRVGQLLNLTDLGRDVGIAASTAGRWMDVLEATHQVLRLRPYYRNLGKRQLKTPKLYFTDTGVLCHLLGWRTAETAASGAMAGALWECHVVGELVKSYTHRGLQAPLWFWRTKEGKEVDVLLEEDGGLHPVEIKLSAMPSRRDLRGIDALARSGAELGHGALICMTREPVALRADVTAMPASAIG